MNIKLIALDLDGTLLLPDKTLSEENRSVLTKAAQEKGIYISIATGRPLSGIRKILEWLPCVRYVILSNGAIVQDAYTGEIITKHLVKTKDALAFYDYAASQKLIVDFFDRGERLVSPDWERYVNQMEIPQGTRQLLLSNCTIVGDQRSYLENLSGVEKISVRFRDEAERKRHQEQMQAIFPQLQICSSLETNVEANCKNVTKASGIHDLIAHLGIGIDTVMAFGDNGNDYEMIEAAGIGVAMGNSETGIKKIADKITKSNTEDGVAYMVKEVLGW